MYTLENYTIKEPLGRGGISEVYTACLKTDRLDLKKDQEVAIKLYRQEMIGKEFLKETEVMQRLNKVSGIVKLIETVECKGDYGQKYPCIVMEKIEGLPLSEVTLTYLASSSNDRPCLKSIKKENLNPYSPKIEIMLDYREVISLMVKVAEIVYEAHRKNIIHCDLKPANILVDTKKEPWLLDFNVARLPAFSSGSASVGLLGTVEYMSPEQTVISGRGDNRCDIWALGVILYELFAGWTPFSFGVRKENNQILESVGKGEYKKLSQVCELPDEYLEAICAHALQVLPGGRYKTAKEMAEDLRKIESKAYIRNIRKFLQESNCHEAWEEIGKAIASGWLKDVEKMLKKCYEMELGKPGRVESKEWKMSEDQLRDEHERSKELGDVAIAIDRIWLSKPQYVLLYSHPQGTQLTEIEINKEEGEILSFVAGVSRVLKGAKDKGMTPGIPDKDRIWISRERCFAISEERLATLLSPMPGEMTEEAEKLANLVKKNNGPGAHEHSGWEYVVSVEVVAWEWMSKESEKQGDISRIVKEVTSSDSEDWKTSVEAWQKITLQQFQTMDTMTLATSLLKASVEYESLCQEIIEEKERALKGPEKVAWEATKRLVEIYLDKRTKLLHKILADRAIASAEIGADGKPWVKVENLANVKDSSEVKIEILEQSHPLPQISQQLKKWPSLWIKYAVAIILVIAAILITNIPWNKEELGESHPLPQPSQVKEESIKCATNVLAEEEWIKNSFAGEVPRDILVSKNNHIKLINILGTRCLHHSERVNDIKITKDNKYIVSGSDYTIKIWDFQTGKEIRSYRFANYMRAVAITEDEKYIVAAGGRQIKILDFRTGNVRWSYYDNMNELTLSEDGKYILFGDGNSSIKVLDFETGKEIKLIKSDSDRSYIFINTVALTKDNKYIISSAKEFASIGWCATHSYTYPIINIWEFQTGKEIRTIYPHEGEEGELSVRLSEDGKYIVSTNKYIPSPYNKVKIWDFQTGREVGVLKVGTLTITCDSLITRDNKYIISGGNDVIKVWDWQTGKEIRTLKGHTSGVSRLTLSKDEKYIVSAGDDEIKVWDWQTGEKSDLLKTEAV